VFAGCATRAEDEQAVPAVVQADVATVRAEPFTETVDAIGTVTGRPGASASLSAPANARVARVLASVGERVSAGQPLVVLDQTTFATAARSADAELSAAAHNADRTRRLADEGILPRKDAEQAAADLARARADAAQARRQEQLATLRSPIAGVVTRVAATLGATADPAQPLVEIVDPRALDVVLGVTPSDAARIRRGATVTLFGGQSAGGEPLGTGSVADVGAIVDAASRSVSVRVHVPAARRPLRVGEVVFGRVAVNVRQAVVVPVAALVPEGDTFKVFVVDAGGIAHERPVKVGARNETTAEILDGVRAGERVVTSGAYGVADSAKVVPLGRASDSAGTGSAASPGER
jgi:RND family efflux transporter MFP subunit